MIEFSNKVNKLFLASICFLLVLLAIYFCKIGGYGSDEDTLPMIGTFETILTTGRYMSSRFTGYPVSEIIIGFFSIYLGSFYINLIIFFSFFFSLFILFFSFEKEIKLNEKFFLFLVLSFSNPVLYFDNLEPIDYSLALLFFSIGVYFYKLKNLQISVLFFAICIGARINFAVFIITFIFLENFKVERNIFVEKFITIFNTIFFGCLFYTPIWFINKFGFDWLTAARPVDQGIIGLTARYFYKLWHAFGNYSVLLLIPILYILFKKKIFLNIRTLPLTGIIIANLFLFFYIPAELSYLQPGIIILYIILIQNLSQKLIYGLIILNFLSWFIKFDVINIYYKYNLEDNCKNITREAVDIEFHLKFEKGSLQNFLDTRNQVLCYSNDNDERFNRIKNGQSLRIKK